MQARITEDLFTAIVSGVRYDDDGIATVQGAVQSRLSNAIDQGVAARDPFPTVTVPKKSSISQTDIANRHLPDVKFSFYCLGFIESISVDGIASL